MTECTNEAMRDQLPLLARDALGAAEAARVRAHVEGCAACRTELALLARTAAAIDAATPRVDIAAVTAAVRRATLVRPLLTPPRARPRIAAWAPRRAVAMAASLLLVATASLAVVSKFYGPDGRLSDVAAVDSALGTRVVASGGIAVPGGLAELSDDELVTLLEELDRVEATVNAEPISMRQAIVDIPEEF